jgi:PIN domain nuclease of toxin-antitoxin system
MNLLLDTHVFLWFIDKSASLWEMAIKIGIGRLRIEQPFERLIPEQMEKNGFSLLPLRIAHMAKVTALPFYHRDPFDRLLAAQCLTEDFSLISVDAVFDNYAVRRLW